MYEIVTGRKCTTPGMLNRNEQGELTKTLRAADLERRTTAARSFLEEHRK
jgi:hypothetical protein